MNLNTIFCSFSITKTLGNEIESKQNNKFKICVYNMYKQYEKKINYLYRTNKSIKNVFYFFLFFYEFFIIYTVIYTFYTLISFPFITHFIFSQIILFFIHHH